MLSSYEELSWEVNVKLQVNSDATVVSTEYKFGNGSNEYSFYFGLLPRFQSVPYRSLLNGKKIVIEAIIVNPRNEQTQLFSQEKKAEGIDNQSDCFIPIPWPHQPGAIPPGSLLKLTFIWLERGPMISQEGGKQQWDTEYHLPLSKLFLPLALDGKNGLRNIVPSCQSINIEIAYPEGSSFRKTPEFKTFSPKPKNFKPGISHFSVAIPAVTLSFQPIPEKPFSDFKFELPAPLAIPIEYEELIFNQELKRIRQYTKEVIVAVVDLRGSSIKAEEQRSNPNPTSYTSNFQRLARESFPKNKTSISSKESPVISMKKVVGDMLMLVGDSTKSAEIVEETLRFTRKLSSEKIPFRAGFHVDQATDTGNLIHSLNEQGTDYLGPALNWAAKIGDDKKNTGVRITNRVVDKLSKLSAKYEFVSVGFHDQRKDLEIFDLKEREEDLCSGANLKPEMFSHRLNDRILKLNSRVCVGLDPELCRYPSFILKQHNLGNIGELNYDDLNLQDVSECIISFNKIVIDIVCEDAVAIKPQSAHYERYGYQGILALEETAKYATEKGLLVILDAKRNDIGSTAEKYALAYLGYDSGVNNAAIPFDAMTINPYLGTDGVTPFVKSCSNNGKGIFILVKTSNESSGEIQDLVLKSDKQLSHHIAGMVHKWGEEVIGTGGFSSVGAVMGATYPDDIKGLRLIMPNAIFLIPGYGAQGAKADEISSAFDDKGLGAIINSARAITYCYPTEDDDFREKIKTSVVLMKNDINSHVLK